jgi:hypothetical protein
MTTLPLIHPGRSADFLQTLEFAQVKTGQYRMYFALDEYQQSMILLINNCYII